jgi:hypothetical protein
MTQLWAGSGLDNRMKRLHVYMSEEQYAALKAHADRLGVSSSRAIRLTLPGPDAVRQYLPDGRHTENAKIARILATISS